MNDTSRLTFLGHGIERFSTVLVTVVGCGGGGSHLVQQLAHIGIGTVAILDEDSVENSNVNRLVCSNYGDVGKPKVEVLAHRLNGLAGRVVPVPCRVQSPEGRAWIERSDVVIGAVDGMRTRDYIERACRAALVPYIDIGLTIVMAEKGSVGGIGGQVFISVPAGPCMWCAGILTNDELAGDHEEYVAGAPEQQVISMNGILASQAINAALWLLTRFAPAFPPPAHIVYDGLEHELRRNDYLPKSCSHYPVESAGWSVVLPPRRVVRP